MERTKKEKKDVDSVSSEEFAVFKDSVEATQNKILDMLERMSQPMVQPLVMPGEPFHQSSAKAVDTGYLPPQYQGIFEKYFDPEDGFTARLTFPEVGENGEGSGGITFTIVVPEKFSNNSPAHKVLYKADLRTKALMPHNIAKGIDDWCKLVCTNLHYDKKLKLK